MEQPSLDDKSPPLRHFFQKVDWVAFGLTTLLTGVIYVLTLSPEEDLEHSGVFATAAMYPSASVPPGHPFWALYGWMFIKFWPFGNIAWRLALASALAGAVTCGLVALLVSRVGWLAVGCRTGNEPLGVFEMTGLRVVCGVVAGLGWGLDGCVWRQAVVPETRSLEWLLFALTVCCMTRWFFDPQKRSWLYAAALIGGLGLSENQGLVAAALGMPFLVAAGDRKVGRDLFLITGMLLYGMMVHYHNHPWQGERSEEGMNNPLCMKWIIGIAMISGGILAIQTRSFFKEWKAAALFILLLVTGLGAYLLLPLYSLTNPPMNWGYTRTVEGFWHALCRDQFESMVLTSNWSQLQMQLRLYLESVRDDLGALYFLVAGLPMLRLHKLPVPARNWLVGLLVFELILVLLTVMGLNDNQIVANYCKVHFAASHWVIAVLAGCGLMAVGVWFAGAGSPASSKSPSNGQPAD